MSELQRTPGRHVTRRLTEPRFIHAARRDPGVLAEALAESHNRAVAEYGSNSGGWHAFDPASGDTAGVFDAGPYPDGTVVSDLAWGRIDPTTAQCLLEMDGVDA